MALTMLPITKPNFSHACQTLLKTDIILEKRVDKRTERRTLGKNHNQKKNRKHQDHRNQPPHLILPQKNKQLR